MDLSRLFANINHDRLISKLNAYDATNATKDSLKFIKKLAKIAGKEHVLEQVLEFWTELLLGVLQASSHRTLAFSICKRLQ